MNAEIFGLHLAALVIGFAETVFLIPHSIRQQSLDQPDNNGRVHSNPVPRLSGMGILITTTIPSALLIAIGVARRTVDIAYPTLLPGVVVGGFVVFLTGLFDDLKGISPRGKLAAQTVAALVVIV